MNLIIHCVFFQKIKQWVDYCFCFLFATSCDKKVFRQPENVVKRIQFLVFRLPENTV
ncbi:MAG: hypothetical protein IJR44_06155 [Neisseriaceae bacterium]|nr:hypothetical protein [Neisseriaceae bacterium]